MSDTNRVGLRYIKEVDPGVTPTGALAVLPFTGSSDLGFTPETTTSNIIRSDRQVSDLVLVNGTVGGGFDTELIAGNALDSLLDGVMFSGTTLASQTAVVKVNNLSVTFTDVVGGTRLTATGITAGPVVAGDVVKVVNANETVVAAVVSVASGVSITISAPTTSTGAVSGTTVTLLPSIRNGTTQSSYTMERTYRTDEAGVFREYLRGMVPGTFSMSASASSIVESSFSFIGQTQAFSALLGGMTRPDAPPYGVYNSASNVATIAIGGEAMGDNFVMEASIEIENNLRERNALGTLGAISVGAGEFSVTGSLNTYFNNSTLIQKVIDNSETSLTLAFQSGNESIMFFLPRVKFSEGTPDVSGKNEDVMAAISFQAILDPTTSYTMAIAKDV